MTIGIERLPGEPDMRGWYARDVSAWLQANASSLSWQRVVEFGELIARMAYDEKVKNDARIEADWAKCLTRIDVNHACDAYAEAAGLFWKGVGRWATSEDYPVLFCPACGRRYSQEGP